MLTKLSRLVIAVLVAVLLISAIAPTTYAAPPAQSCTQYHTVQRGENLYRIALKYGTTVSELQRINKIANPNRIYAGQRLCVKGGQQPAPVATTISRLRLRTGPGIDFSIVTVMPAGQQITMLGRNQAATWVYLRYGNTEGWSRASFLRTSYQLSQLPINTGYTQQVVPQQ